MATIQGIYVALFGRPADPAGLAFFNEATNNGADLTAIGDLAATAEYQARFEGQTNTQIINSIYETLFGRAGETEGVEFFLAELEAGRLNINNIAIAILDGAQGDDLAAVNAKIAAADIFTTHLDLQVEIDAYTGGDAAAIGRAFLDAVSGTDPGTEAEADAAILLLLGEGGQNPDNGGGGGGGVSNPGEASYGSADVLLLDNSTVKGEYSYNPEAGGTLAQVVQAVSSAFMDAYNSEDGTFDGNTLLINNLDPIIDLIPNELAAVTGVVSQLLPEYAGWTPDTLFFGIPGEDSTVKGTSGNDIAVFLGGDHTFTGGRGNDVIITADVGGLIPVSLPIPVSNDISPFDSELTPAKHSVDGGADSDIIINVGGDENVLVGGAGQDVIVSVGDAMDTIDGGNGNDFIFGGSDHANEVIYTKLAADEESSLSGPDFSKGDTLTGGNGADTFLFLPEGQIADEGTGLEYTPLGNIVSNGADTITDFETGTDTIGIFVAENSTIGYVEDDGGETGFADYDAAASAAWASFNPSVGIAEVATTENVDIQVFFAANVDGDGYLFVDDNVDGSTDFVIKFDGLNALDDLSAEDIQAIDVSGILEYVGGVIGSNVPFMTDVA